MQDDYSDILIEVAQSLDSYSGQYLKDNIKKNVSLLLPPKPYQKFHSFFVTFSSYQRDEIEKYESELIAKDNMLEECHRKIEEMDEKLKLLEAENRMLLTQKSREELERIQMKKQSMTLSLKNTTSTSDVQTDTHGLVEGAKTSETETCDTFHTANSDCSFASALPSPFPPRTESRQTPPASESNSELAEPGKALMSDSGVCLDAKIHEASTSSANVTAHPLAKHCLDGDNLSTNSSQNFYEQLLQSQMGKLRAEVAAKKAEIMRVLELGGDKTVLDDMINDLQELQKDYVKMEMRLETTRGKHFSTFADDDDERFLLLAQMVAFRMAKRQRNCVKSPAAPPIATNHVTIRWRCRRYQRAPTASRRACLRII